MLVVVVTTATALRAQTATLTNPDGTFNGWGGFDLASNGTWAFSGYDNSNAGPQSITAVHWATSVPGSGGLTDAGGGGFFAPNNNWVYQYTSVLTLQLTATATATSGGLNTALNVAFDSGTFSIYYDPTADAVNATGAGYTDADLLFSGSLTSATGSNGWSMLTGATPNTFVNAQGTVTYTNSAYVSPDLATVNFSSTTQTYNAGWPTVTGEPGPNGTSASLPSGTLIYSGDANLSVTPVPEPSTALSLSVAVTAMFARRRR